jgi:peptide deformylase
MLYFSLLHLHLCFQIILLFFKINSSMIVLYPNDVLTLPCKEVKEIDDSLRNSVENMREEMYKNNGCGLSAPQIGLLQRFFIADCSDDFGFEVFINPIIIKKSQDFVLELEGCLSFPGNYIPVKRHKTVTVEYTNLKGKRKKINCKGLLSRAVQHERDHLDGLLYIDKEEK